MTRRALVMVALVLAAHSVGAADRARSRDGSASSGRGSGAGARHHASPPSSSSSSSDRGSRAVARSGAADPTPAQRRHPRAGTGTGYYPYGGYGYPYGYGSYYYGYGFYPYASFYYGYPYYGYPSYGGYPGYYYGGAYAYGPHDYDQAYASGHSESGALRVLVDPEKTRVYVDGYYAGIVDDFDGMFQRLHLSPGRHEIMLKLEGYRTHRFRVYVPVGQTLKLHHDMVRGEGEDAEEVVGEPEVVGRPAGYARLEDEDRESGALRVDVRPLDASIYVDGAFRGAARDLDRLRLAPGRHRIEIVRPGYRIMERDVDIRPGETTELRADLDRS